MLAACIGGQYLLFREHVQREVAWGYPRMWDQGPLLANSYAVHEAWRETGASSAFAEAWRRRAPQGGLIYFEAALLMQALGASRLSALTLNFLHHALLMVLLAVALRRLAPGWSAPALALGLLLALRSPAYWGGLTDFRLDFGAMCLQGVWLCLALRADALAHRRGALLAAAAALALAAFRYITLTYTLATLAAFAALELLVTRRAPASRARARGAALVALVACAGVLPFFWASRAQLVAYYWGGQIVAGGMLERAMGLLTAADVWLYYPRSLWEQHLGPLFLLLAAVTLVAAAAYRPPASRSDAETRAGHTSLAPGARLLACATLVPLLVLTLNPAKSPVVANALLPGLVLLVALPAVASMRRGGGWLWPALAAAAFVAGLGHHTAFLRGPGPLAAEPEDSRATTALHEAVARVSLERGWRRPLVLVDSSEEHAVRWNTSVVAYERYGALIEPVLPLSGIEWRAVLPAQLERELPRIQIAILTDPGPGGPRDRPFDLSMAALRPAIQAACERDFEPVGDYNLRGRRVRLFARLDSR